MFLSAACDGREIKGSLQKTVSIICCYSLLSFERLIYRRGLPLRITVYITIRLSSSSSLFFYFVEIFFFFFLVLESIHHHRSTMTSHFNYIFFFKYYESVADIAHLDFHAAFKLNFVLPLDPRSSASLDSFQALHKNTYLSPPPPPSSTRLYIRTPFIDRLYEIPSHTRRKGGGDQIRCILIGQKIWKPPPLSPLYSNLFILFVVERALRS